MNQNTCRKDELRIQMVFVRYNSRMWRKVKVIGKDRSFSSDLCSLMKVNAGFDIDLQTDLWKQNHATFKSEIRTLPVPVFMSS